MPEVGLAGKKNGELLSLAEVRGFEVFVTLDRGIEYEQSIRRRNIAVVLIRTKSSRMADLLPHVPEILYALRSLRAGQLVHAGRG